MHGTSSLRGRGTQRNTPQRTHLKIEGKWLAAKVSLDALSITAPHHPSCRSCMRNVSIRTAAECGARAAWPSPSSASSTRVAAGGNRRQHMSRLSLAGILNTRANTGSRSTFVRHCSGALLRRTHLCGQLRKGANLLMLTAGTKLSRWLLMMPDSLLPFFLHYVGKPFLFMLTSAHMWTGDSCDKTCGVWSAQCCLHAAAERPCIWAVQVLQPGCDESMASA